MEAAVDGQQRADDIAGPFTVLAQLQQEGKDDGQHAG
jgi:hypothetical protein